LHKELVNLPKNTILDEIIDDLKRYLFFADYIRVLNGIYLLIII
jgi:hypothetical protein